MTRICASVLTGYFPAPLRDAFASQMAAHPLRREIITTAVVNDMVDRSGITFLFRMNEETGASIPDISCAWLVVREVFGMPDFWARVEALDGQVEVATQLALLLEGHKLTERATRWLLHSRRPPFDIQADDRLLRGRGAHGQLGPAQAADRPGPVHRVHGPAGVVQRPAACPLSWPSGWPRWCPPTRPSTWWTSPPATGRGIEETAEVYFDLADRLQITRLRDRITALPRDDRWNTMARAALRDDVYAAHAAITRDVLQVTGPGSPEERLAVWVARNEPAVLRATQTLTEIWESDRFTVATLSVAVRAIRTLVAASALPEHP